MALLSDHQCEWRSEAERLAQEIESLKAEMEQLKRHFLGPKSEKIPTPDAEIKKADNERADPEETRRKREENALSRTPKKTREILHRVPDEKRACPRCTIALLPKGAGWTLDAPLIEYVGDTFELEVHKLETLECPECRHLEIAQGPLRVIEGGRYGPAFFAFLIVAKCGDSIPIYRLEKRFKRLGISMPRSTMNDLVHAAATLLEAIHKRMMVLIRESDLVLADETSMRVQKRKKRGFVWTFTVPLFDGQGRARWIKAYKFSPDRSGDTPKEVLGGTKGYLVVDMYTGYNPVTTVDGRERAACNAHSRRGYWEALETAPEGARKALDFYLEAFRVEREAKKLGIEGTAAHLELRVTKSRPIMDRFKAWLEEERPRHLPKGPMGTAISYTLNHWGALTLFLTDARIPFTNNISESNLRVIALGRKNFMHFGNDQAGRNFAILYSIVSSCEANGVNPIEYLKDVLIRVQTHPASRIDELLPHRWRLPTDGGSDSGGPGGDGAHAGDADGNGDSSEEEAQERAGHSELDVEGVSPCKSDPASQVADHEPAPLQESADSSGNSVEHEAPGPRSAAVDSGASSAEHQQPIQLGATGNSTAIELIVNLTCIWACALFAYRLDAQARLQRSDKRIAICRARQGRLIDRDHNRARDGPSYAPIEAL